MLFKKKEETPQKVLPVNEILDMKQRGMSNQQIIHALRSMGYSLSDIKNAISQAEIKGAVNSPMPTPDIPEQPMPNFQPQQQMQFPQPAPQQDMNQQFGINQQPNFDLPKEQPEPVMNNSNPKISDDLVDELQRIIEKIISEKWEDVDKKLEDLDVWKASVDQKVNDALNRVKEFEKRLDAFSATLIKRENDYKKSMDNVNVEMQALDKMMGKLIPSLSDEIKELRDVVNKIRKE